MTDKKAYNPKGKCIVFNEEHHKYTVDGKELISATTVLGEFFPKFDADRIAYFVARKQGKTKEAVLKEWDDKREEACTFGTNVHLYAEMKLMGGAVPKPDSTREKTAFRLVENYLEKLLREYDVVEAEKIVFSEDIGISGTIDLVLRNKKSKKICLLDWKTNRKIEKSNSYSKPAHPPIEDLNDANYTKYMLQLNLYKYIMEREGYFDEVDEMMLVHIRPRSTKEYRIKDQQEHIESIVEYRRNKKQRDEHNNNILKGDL